MIENFLLSSFLIHSRVYVKMQVQLFFSIPRSHNCGFIFTRFHVVEKKKRSSVELSNNISSRVYLGFVTKRAKRG